MHCTNGTIDNLAANEQECFEQLRILLSYLPNWGGSLPPTVLSKDPVDRMCENLRSIIPRRKARMYDARKIITSVSDKGSWFEIGALWGSESSPSPFFLLQIVLGAIRNGPLHQSSSTPITYQFCLDSD